MSIKERYQQGEDPVKLFREQVRFTHFVNFMTWLED